MNTYENLCSTHTYGYFSRKNIYMLNILHIFSDKNVKGNSELIKWMWVFIEYTSNCAIQLKAKNCLNLFSSHRLHKHYYFACFMPSYTYSAFQQESFDHPLIHPLSSEMSSKLGHSIFCFCLIIFLSQAKFLDTSAKPFFGL